MEPSNTCPMTRLCTSGVCLGVRALTFFSGVSCLTSFSFPLFTLNISFPGFLLILSSVFRIPAVFLITLYPLMLSRPASGSMLSSSHVLNEQPYTPFLVTRLMHLVTSTCVSCVVLT